MQAHLETYLALAREGHDHGGSVPQYVEAEFCCYLIAFSCKGRGVCPSCNARRMAETAAHLADHVLPRLPVHPWVLSVPKRLRYFLQHDPKAISAVPHILLRVIEARPVQCSGRVRAGGWGR